MRHELSRGILARYRITSGWSSYPDSVPREEEDVARRSIVLAWKKTKKTVDKMKRGLYTSSKFNQKKGDTQVVLKLAVQKLK